MPRPPFGAPPMFVMRVLDYPSRKRTRTLGRLHIGSILPFGGRGLVGLEEVYLDGNRISNLAPLSGLSALTGLYLSENNLTDITPLGGLTRLERLDVSFNQLDLTPGSATMNTIAALRATGTVVEYEQPQTVPTVLALTTGSSNSLAYGGTLAVRGTLKAADEGVVGVTVILQSRPVGGVFAGTTLRANTGTGGAFSFSVKPASWTEYRVRFAGMADLEASVTGSTVYALPKVSAGNPVAASTMSHTKNYGYVTATAANYSTYSKCSAKVKLPYKGKWRLRAYAPADAGHAATWSSGYDYVFVN